MLPTDLRHANPATSLYIVSGNSRPLIGLGMIMNGANAAEFVFEADNDGFWRLIWIRGGVTASGMMTWASSVILATEVLEFAISATENGSGIADDWVPQHGAADGAVVTSSQTITVNGVSTTMGAISTTPTAVTEVVLTQSYTAYSPNDTSQVNPLWTGTIVHKFNIDGLTITHSFTTLTDVFVNNGYFGQVEATIAQMNRLRASNGYTRTLVTPGVQQSYNPGSADSVLVDHATTGFAISAGVKNINDATENLDYVDDDEPTLLLEKTDGAAKWYWRIADSSAVIPNGTTFSTENYYYAAAGAAAPPSRFATPAARTQGSTAATTTPSLTLPSGGAGELILVWLSANSQPTISWVGAGFTALAEDRSADDALFLGYRWTDGTEGGSIAPTLNSANECAYSIQRITGALHPLSGGLEVSASAVGTDTAPNPPNLALAGGLAKDILWICGGNTSNGNRLYTAAPSGYGNLATADSVTAGAGTAIGTAERQLNAASENPGTFTINTSSAWKTFTVAVHPAPSTSLPLRPTRRRMRNHMAR